MGWLGAFLKLSAKPARLIQLNQVLPNRTDITEQRNSGAGLSGGAPPGQAICVHKTVVATDSVTESFVDKQMSKEECL
jgi:hypothetical protein